MGRLRLSSRGFTLVEMLVVIAIIAVLAAILFPVFAIVRGKARRARCESNLRQVGAALMLYADDYNGYLPSFSPSHPSWVNTLTNTQKNTPQPGLVVTWDISIQDRLRNTDVLTCTDNPFGPDKRAYAMTAYSMKAMPNMTFYGERIENIPNRTAIVLLFEKGKNLPGSWGDAMGENVRQSHASKWPTVDPEYSEALFHQGGKNFLFLDGHAKWFQAESGPFLNQAAASDPVQDPGACFIPGRRAEGGEWPDPE